MLPLGDLSALPCTISFSMPSPSATNSGMVLLWLKPTVSLMLALDSCTFAHSHKDSERSMWLALSEYSGFLNRNLCAIFVFSQCRRALLHKPSNEDLFSHIISKWINLPLESIAQPIGLPIIEPSLTEVIFPFGLIQRLSGMHNHKASKVEIKLTQTQWCVLKKQEVLTW